MRTIEFSDLKLKDNCDEETFYKMYLENLPNAEKHDDIFNIPKKQYEIFLLNILGGKLILLNKDYITNKDNDNSDCFFDYSIALKVYNLWLDIMDGIENEKNEFNELYKDERLQKNDEIEQLKEQDNIILEKKQKEYNSLINSDLYKNYLKLEEENKKLKNENEELKEKIKNISINESSNNISFFQKIINKFKYKRLSK